MPNCSNSECKIRIAGGCGYGYTEGSGVCRRDMYLVVGSTIEPQGFNRPEVKPKKPENKATK